MLLSPIAVATASSLLLCWMLFIACTAQQLPDYRFTAPSTASFLLVGPTLASPIILCIPNTPSISHHVPYHSFILIGSIVILTFLFHYQAQFPYQVISLTPLGRHSTLITTSTIVSHALTLFSRQSLRSSIFFLFLVGST